jgi:hypothetical protein
VISAIIFTTALLLAMFSTQGDNQRTEVLFGGLFFQTAPTFSGVAATMGVGNPGPLVITFLVAGAFGYLVQAVYSALKRRRDVLLVASPPA